jgi:hypothetical protein
MTRDGDGRRIADLYSGVGDLGVYIIQAFHPEPPRSISRGQGQATADLPEGFN